MNYPQDYPHHCRIEEIWPKNTDKLFLCCGSVLHRGVEARGNIPHIVADEFWAKYVNIDYPAKEYTTEKVVQEMLIYISKQKNIQQIILVWLSFWELPIRDLIQMLPDYIQKKIVGHLSINGVFCWQDLKPQYQIVVPLLSTRLAKVLLGILETLSKKNFVFQWKVSLMRVFVPEHKKNDNSKHYQESLHNLKEAGALGLTAGLSDRARRILQETQPQNIGAIQTIAIASSDDDTYVNPKNQSTALNSAERIKNLSLHPRSEVRVLENAGHAALVENPEPYDTTIQQALQTFGRKKLQ